MATISLTLFKAKVLKDGRHNIRVALRHKHKTAYIVTNFIVEENQFNEGRVVKRSDASVINSKLRGLLDLYQERIETFETLNFIRADKLRV